MLYALVKRHLGELLQHARESYEAPYPSMWRTSFADFARGFVHTECTNAGTRCLLHT